jgi:hypothetical protein
MMRRRRILASSPNEHSFLRLARQLLEQRKHVLVEKPKTENGEQALEIVALRKKMVRVAGRACGAVQSGLPVFGNSGHTSAIY